VEYLLYKSRCTLPVGFMPLTYLTSQYDLTWLHWPIIWGRSYFTYIYWLKYRLFKWYEDRSKTQIFILTTPGVNFINVLRTAFTLVGPKSVKRYWRLDWVLMLWGTTGVKAVRRTLMKSSPGVNFIKILHTIFFVQTSFQQLFQRTCN